jgi:hypothetical protein
MKLKAKLLVLLVSCSALPLIGMAWLSYGSAKQALNSQIESSLVSINQHQVSMLENFFDEAFNDLHTWSRLGIMQDVLTDDEEGEAGEELVRLRREYPHFAELTMINSEGRIVSSTREPRLNQPFTELKAIHQQVQQGHHYQGRVAVDPLSGGLVLLISEPIRADYDPETVVGALVGVVDWQIIQKQLGRVSINGQDQDLHHRLILLGDDGELLYPVVDQAINDASVLPVQNGVRQVELGTKDYLVATNETLGAEKFENPKWRLHALLATEIAYAPVIKLRTQSLLLVSVVILVIVLLGLLGTQQIVKPITRVAQRLTDISEGEGDLTVELEVSGRDEVADLARALTVLSPRSTAPSNRFPEPQKGWRNPQGGCLRSPRTATRRFARNSMRRIRS